MNEDHWQEVLRRSQFELRELSEAVLGAELFAELEEARYEQACLLASKLLEGALRSGSHDDEEVREIAAAAHIAALSEAVAALSTPALGKQGSGLRGSARELAQHLADASRSYMVWGDRLRIFRAASKSPRRAHRAAGLSRADSQHVEALGSRNFNIALARELGLIAFRAVQKARQRK